MRIVVHQSGMYTYMYIQAIYECTHVDNICALSCVCVNLLREKCEQVQKVMNAIKGSIRLRSILHVCLKAGNILNVDSKQLGVSQGFKLSSFSKIAATKGNKNGLSFLDYIIDKLLNRLPNMLALHSEFSELEGCRQVNLIAITSDLKTLESQLETSNKLIESKYTNEASPPPEGSLEMLEKAKIAIERCKLSLEEGVESYCAVCEYIGEEKELSKVEDVIAQTSNVVSAIVNATQAALGRKQKEEVSAAMK